MRLELPYLMPDTDRHGSPRLFVRRYGRKIRIRETPGTVKFATAYAAALAKLDSEYGPKESTAPPPPVAKPRTFGWLVNKYVASGECKGVAKGVLASCLLEPIEPGGSNLMRDCPLSELKTAHVRMLRDRKKNAGLNGAANNRKKYVSGMFGWAIEQDPPLMESNPAREAKRVQYATDGFHTWSIPEVMKYRERHPIGTKARLAMEMLLFIGVRRGDFVRLGPPMLTKAGIEFVPRKTRHRRERISVKPILPCLAAVIAGTTLVGAKTFLVTEYGEPFTAAGFGNWFADRCVEAGAPGRAHGLRKAGATLAAEEGATVPQLMAMYDWDTPTQAEVYIRKANRKRMAADAMPLIARGMDRGEGA